MIIDQPDPEHKLLLLFLKMAADIISPPITYQFNLSLIWKPALVPSLKLYITDNYRPISKLCILSKLLENVVNEQLIWYLNTQSGFIKKQSTNTAVLKV